MQVHSRSLPNEGARMYGTLMPPLERFLLPYPIVKFYMVEARELAVRGRLLLVPAPMVGCLGPGFHDSERLFCDIAAADAIIRKPRPYGSHNPLEMVVPWFPSIPLRDLAALCDDHQEGLAKLRLSCLAWSSSVLNDQPLALAKIKTELQLASKDIQRAFERVSGHSQLGSQLATQPLKAFGGRGRRQEIEQAPVRCDANNRATAFLPKEIGEHAWFPYWCFEHAGLRWTLGSALKPSKCLADIPRGAIVSGNVFHWLKAPGELKIYAFGVKKSKANDPPTGGDDGAAREG